MQCPQVGLVDPDVVRDIRSGTGALDTAHDAVNIAAYYNPWRRCGRQAPVHGRIAELSENGRWLIGHPISHPPSPSLSLSPIPIPISHARLSPRAAPGRDLLRMPSPRDQRP
jgi:hypothetical protein